MMIEEKVEKLKANAVFQLSLSSIELFHSNFLYWLCCHYPQIARKLLATWLDKNEYDLVLKKDGVVREKENSKDMIFYLKEKGISKTIYLENKVKSVPDEEQLQKYSVNRTHTEGILLSIIPPSFMEKKKRYENVLWTYIDYKQLAFDLRKISSEFMEEGSYHHQLIKDYIELIEFLSELPFEVKIDDCYNWYQGETFKMTQSLRIYDLYLKGKMTLLAKLVIEHMKEKHPELSFINSSKWDEGRVGDIYYRTSFSNGSSLMDLKYVIEPGKCIGAQLQDKDFRLFIETKKTKESLDLFNDYYQNKQWFELNGLPCTHPEKKDFNKFNDKKEKNTFLYRSFKLKKPSVQDIINRFDQAIIKFKKVK